MDKQTAAKLITGTFENPFDKNRFVNFSKNLVNHLDVSDNFTYQGNLIYDSFEDDVQSLERIGKYTDDDGKKIDLLIVKLKKSNTLERARTRQRNYIARYLQTRGEKDAALVAFVSPDLEDWRFSLIKMEYELGTTATGRIKAEIDLTPARRYSFLVGKNESSHTAQNQLLPILENDVNVPSLTEFEKAFSVEVVTHEFFTKYRELFWDVEEALETLAKSNELVKDEFNEKNIDIANFAKKLLGQIVFLYFLQKKGWFGVGRDAEWGMGHKDFLRRLFEKKVVSYKNFFNDILEPLFYNTLALERPDDYSDRFNCKIPFLNGGLFDPINNYDWIHNDILLPNEVFSNIQKTAEGDIGTGILDIFDRYNFTVKEDEPLDKEVAVDPEMLGKVFENLLEIKDRKSKGTYYTPREIVHYMCQESLVNYLDFTLNTGAVSLAKVKPVNLKLIGAPAVQQQAFKAEGDTNRVPREDIEALVHMGDLAIEHDTHVENQGKETHDYSYKLPGSIRLNAALIDEALANIRVCDPAIGSGAFPVGMMTEIVHARSTLTSYMGEKKGRTSYSFKRHAIQNSIYGVDIDPSAVEIAKLRLWLSLVVDEDDIKQIQPLPNLDYKIVCGNSLLGVKRRLENWPLFAELEKLKPLYFEETNAKKKHEYKQQIDQLIVELTDNKKTFDFEIYFSEIFHEKAGFDIIMANPPYVRVDELSEEARNNYKLLYKSTKGKYDLYYLFFEKGFGISHQQATCVFISPNRFCATDSAKELRNILFAQFSSGQIVSTSKIRVFEAASNYPVISLLSKNSNDSAIFRVRECKDLEHIHQETTKSYSATRDDFSIFPGKTICINVSQDAFDLVKKLINRGAFLSEVMAVSEGLRIPQKYESDSPHGSKIVKQFQFSRYSPILAGAAISAQNIGKVLSPTSDRFKKIMQTKILICEDGLRINASLDIEKMIPQGGVYFAVPTNNLSIEFLLGLLNSRLLSYIYEVAYGGMHMGGGYLRYRSGFIENLPLPSKPRFILPQYQSEISTLVNKILSARTKNSNADISALEAKIDESVNKLYALSPEEMALLEANQQ